MSDYHISGQLKTPSSSSSLAEAAEPILPKKFPGQGTKCTITGQYMEITVDKVLRNHTLVGCGDWSGVERPRKFTLIHVIFKNLHSDSLKTRSTGNDALIDSSGKQYRSIVGMEAPYGGASEYRDTGEMTPITFLEPDLELESQAMTEGWLYFPPQTQDVHPSRLILQIHVHDPGLTSGWVRDIEVFEFFLTHVSS